MTDTSVVFRAVSLVAKFPSVREGGVDAAEFRGSAREARSRHHTHIDAHARAQGTATRHIEHPLNAEGSARFGLTIVRNHSAVLGHASQTGLRV